MSTRVKLCPKPRPLSALQVKVPTVSVATLVTRRLLLGCCVNSGSVRFTATRFNCHVTLGVGLPIATQSRENWEALVNHNGRGETTKNGGPETLENKVYYSVFAMCRSFFSGRPDQQIFQAV